MASARLFSGNVLGEGVRKRAGLDARLHCLHVFSPHMIQKLTTLLRPLKQMKADAVLLFFTALWG